MKPAKRITLDGASPPLIVDIAGWRYVFQVTSASDAAFTLTEFTPEHERKVIAGGSER
jgi:hypothetical protein